MTLVIGLTGSIGTGKSTVSERLKELHIPVVDADVIAREVVQPGKVAYENIVAAFGEKILHADRSLNRKALGEIVFADNEKRQRLNRIIHPEIRKEMIRQRDAHIEAGVRCVVLDIPLLFESELTSFVEKIIVVSVEPEIQLERITKRDNSSIAEAQQRIAAQIPVSEKAKQADAVIDNNDTKEFAYEQLAAILEKWNVL